MGLGGWEGVDGCECGRLGCQADVGRWARWHVRGWPVRTYTVSEASMEAVPWCELCAIALCAYAGAPMHVCRHMAAVVYPT